MKLNTTREEPSEQDKIKIMQFKIDLMEQDYKLLQDELARVRYDLEMAQGELCCQVAANDKLREELAKEKDDCFALIGEREFAVRTCNEMREELESAKRVIATCLSSSTDRWDVERAAIEHEAKFGGRE